MKISNKIKPVCQENPQLLPLPYWINGTTSHRSALQSHEKPSESLSPIQLVSGQHTATNQRIPETT